MELVFTDTALEDLEHWKKSGQKAIQNKITSLLKNILQTPYSGIGKPEPLKHNLSGYWSRRINQEHRIIYRVNDGKIIVVSMKFHYP